MLYILDLYLLPHTLSRLIPDFLNGTITSSMIGCVTFCQGNVGAQNADFISKWTWKNSRHNQFEQQILDYSKAINSKYCKFFLYPNLKLWFHQFSMRRCVLHIWGSNDLHHSKMVKFLRNKSIGPIFLFTVYFLPLSHHCHTSSLSYLKGMSKFSHLKVYMRLSF